MKKIIAAIAILAIVLIILSVAAKRHQMNSAEKMTEPQSNLGAGDYDFSLIHDGLKRIYKVHVPPSYDKNHPIPVILAFHGGGGNTEASVKFFNLNSQADRDGFLIAYPEGTGKIFAGKVFGSWNAGECCPPGNKNNVDDVGFISSLISKLEKDFSIDRKRIYATGHSNGALMSYRLACELSDKIAAIAPAGGQDAFRDCHPQRPVPILHMHGTDDRCALYNGGICGGCFAEFLNQIGLPADPTQSEWQCRSVPDYLKEWKRIDGCSDSSKIAYQNGSAQCISFDQCKDKAEVELCTIQGMGHTWPGGAYGVDVCGNNPNGNLCKLWKDGVGNLSNDLSANDAMWEFFQKHPMP